MMMSVNSAAQAAGLARRSMIDIVRLCRLGHARASIATTRAGMRTILFATWRIFG
jgi:hypothetical protein